MNTPANNQSPKLDYRKGPLVQTYHLFEPLSHQTGAEISFDRIGNEELRRIWFYTVNPFLAEKTGKDLLYGIGGKIAFNAVFGTNTQAVCDELVDTGFVHLIPEQKEKVRQLTESGEIVFVKASELGLKGNDDQYRFFPIRTGNYQKDLTIARVPFVGAGWGHGVYLDKVMDFLNTNPTRNIEETNIYLPAIDFVAENVKDGEIVARASRLVSFGSGSDFNAGVRGVDGPGDALRGVLRGEPAESGPEKSGLEELVGKGTDAGRGVAVIHQQDVSPEAWQLLTKKQ